MKLKPLFVLFSVSTMLLSACTPGIYFSGSGRATSLSVSRQADVGEYLVAGNGFTLYTFAQDTTGPSTCNGDCAVKWPPLLERHSLPATLGGKLGIVTRADGQQQVTYDGKPLYFFAGDKAPGDTNGHGVGSVWFAAKAIVVVSTDSSGNETSSSGSGYGY